MIPNKIFHAFRDITVDFLKQEGITALILDVDNTLIPYEVTTAGDEVVAWLQALTDAGISYAFVTNNGKKRLTTFNRDFGAPAFYSSCKPFLRNMRAALAAMNADPAHTANVGDQIFTDTLAGKRMGIRSYLVAPIKDRRDPFTRFKRLLERPFIKKYYRLHGEERP